MSDLRALCKILFLLLPFAFCHPAHAAEKLIGTTCKNDQNATDWDTIAQCSGGTFVRAPYWFGASSDTCNAALAGQMQWNMSAIQYCDGSDWRYVANTVGSVASATTLTTPRSFSITGDATAAAIAFNGSADVALATTVTKLQGQTVSTAVPTAGQSLVWNGTNSLWEPGSVGPMVNGTAAAPGLFFAADTNTGLYRPAADMLAIATAGVERLRVDASGNVGIGTASPAATLDVNGGVKVGLSSTCDTSHLGTIMWDGSNFYGCKSTGWIKIGSACSAGQCIKSDGTCGTIYIQLACYSGNAPEGWRYLGTQAITTQSVMYTYGYLQPCEMYVWNRAAIFTCA